MDFIKLVECICVLGDVFSLILLLILQALRFTETAGFHPHLLSDVLGRWWRHTRLCKWMVYSRATTSEMALRDFLPEVLVALGVVEGLSLTITAVVWRWRCGRRARIVEMIVGCSIEACELWGFSQTAVDFRLWANHVIGSGKL